VYNLNQILKGVANPKRGFIELYSRYKMRQIHQLGDGILSKDWDNLIILDACRYDIFEDLNTLTGELESFTSLGSHTGEFLDRNFSGRSVADTVYIFAKPNPAAIDAEFHDVFNIWREKEGTAAEDWGRERFVSNELMTKRVFEIAEEYPHKRIIAHYTPPHLPFIGPKGKELHEQYTWNISEFYDVATEGDIPLERIWEAYRENLKVTLPHVKRLDEQLTGKTVVTSDHGQAFGEWGVYWHPPGVYIDVLRKVPWLEMPYDRRKKIADGNANKDITDYHIKDISKQLEYLGYKD